MVYVDYRAGRVQVTYRDERQWARQQSRIMLGKNVYAAIANATGALLRKIQNEGKLNEYANKEI
jgi:hypothetical protein